MARFVEELVGGLLRGTFKETLSNHCFAWRRNPTDYAIRNVVRCSIEQDRFEMLCDALEDPTFRERRKAVSGTNGLQADARLGIHYFSQKKFDIVRYLRTLFLEAGARNDEFVTSHQRHCMEFEQFLQLDMPIQERSDVGLHRILLRTFPVDIIAVPEENRPDVRIELLDYAVGTWKCRCGATRGHEERYRYYCPCGSQAGTGLLPDGLPPCSACGKPASYHRCSSCGLRVTLDLMWDLEDTVHPTRYVIPVFVRLRLNSAGSLQTFEMKLIELPLMLGMREIGGRIRFDLPALLWLDRIPNSESWESGECIYFIRHKLRYDRQGTLCKVLEAVLRRTFRGYQKRGSLVALFRSLLLLLPKSAPEKVSNVLSRGFQRRLASTSNLICDQFSRDGDVLKLTNESRECTVAASPTLRSNMALVNRQTLRTEGFVAPSLETVTSVLRVSEGNPVLTPKPCGTNNLHNLDDDGVIRVGALVYPGDVLVGVQRRKLPSDITAGQRTAIEVFGSGEEIAASNVSKDVLSDVDVSRTYDLRVPARVISVVIDVSKKLTLRQTSTDRRKIVRRGDNACLGAGQLARIRIALAVEHYPSVGDTLYGSDGAHAVVCGEQSSASLAELAHHDQMPDVLVAVGHPWAPGCGSGTRQVMVYVRTEELLVHATASHATGARTMIDAEAPAASGAQELTSADVGWLVSRGAEVVARELGGPRAGSVQWGRMLHFNLKEGDEGLLSEPSNIAFLLMFGRTNAWVTAEKLRHVIKLFEAASIRVEPQDSECAFELISAASAMSQSYGEVSKPETIDPATLHPVRDGLFCERIFGPTKNWECACGLHKSRRVPGTTCEQCGVEVTRSDVRRSRVGHIALGVPIVHPWYYLGSNSLLGNVLDMDSLDLQKVILYHSYVVLNPGETELVRHQVMEDDEYLAARHRFGVSFEAGIGAEAVRRLLMQLDLDALADRLGRTLIERGEETTDEHLKEQHAIVNRCRSSRSALDRIVLDVLPVLPAALRPMLPLESGKFATSDLNELYRRVINCNGRLRRLLELDAPAVIVRNEKSMLQRYVDQLLGNARLSRPATDGWHRPLVSIGDKLQNRQESFTTLLDKLLYKLVDYSGTTRVVAVDTSSIDVAALPEVLAWDLFAVSVDRKLAETEQWTLKKAAKERGARTQMAYCALQRVCAEAVVLAAIEDSPWRLVCLRVELSKQQALGVHADILERLGWNLLGKKVRLFAVLSREGREVARLRLLPSCLLASNGAASAQVDMPSVWSVPTDRIVAEFAQRALYAQRFPTTIYDLLAASARSKS